MTWAENWSALLLSEEALLQHDICSTGKLCIPSTINTQMNIELCFLGQLGCQCSTEIFWNLRVCFFHIFMGKTNTKLECLYIAQHSYKWLAYITLIYRIVSQGLLDFFWTEVYSGHISYSGLALAILVLWYK